MWCVARRKGGWERLDRVRGGEGKPRIGSRKHTDVDETGLERGRVVKQQWALIEAEGCRGTGELTTRRGCTGTASKAGWHRSGGKIVLLIREFCPGGQRQRLTVNHSTLLV